MQSTEIQGAQKLMKNFASTKNTPGSITTSKLGNKVAQSKASKNLQNINKQQQHTNQQSFNGTNNDPFQSHSGINST